jgi:Ca-activated chloride channel family protein
VSDHARLQRLPRNLNAIDTNIVPRGGTNISSAIQEAQAALRRRPGSDKIVILVTDGEDLEGSALTAAQNAKQQDGLRIFTVGVGTPGGDLIPVPPAQGGGFVKDESGQFVKSHLDEAGLKAIADATGGFYVPLGAQGEGLETIYNNVLGSLAKHDLASRQQKIYIERYQWPLAASLAALLLSLLIGNRRRRSRKATAKERRSPRAAHATASTASLALHPLSCTHSAIDPACPLLPLTLTVTAHTPTPRRHRPSPRRFRRRPSSEPIQAYNAGTAAYRAGQFPQAAQAFQQSITHSPSNDPKRLADQEDAYYNLGNTLYRTGQKSEKSAPQDAIKTWTDAVKAYETALQLKPDDADSKYNRDLVKRKIAKLQQQKPPDQNKDKNDKDKNDRTKAKVRARAAARAKASLRPANNRRKTSRPSRVNSRRKTSRPQGQQPPQGQPPPGQQQGQQPPPGQQPGQQPPPGQQPGQQPPPGQQPGQQPPPGQQPGQQPPAGDQSQGQPPGAAEGDDARAADNQHLPGQMSREEARELLDSVKGDEKRPPGVPMAQDATDVPQQQPTKNW